MNSEKYLYFRKVASLADDDDDESSAFFPVRSLYRVSTASNTILFYFEPIYNKNNPGYNAAHSVVVAATSAGNARTLVRGLFEAIKTADVVRINVYDEVDDTSDLKASLISSIGSISINTT